MGGAFNKFLYRKQYEKVVNTVKLTIHPSVYYAVSGGALKNVLVRGHVIGGHNHITNQVLPDKLVLVCGHVIDDCDHMTNQVLTSKLVGYFSRIAFNVEFSGFLSAI